MEKERFPMTFEEFSSEYLEQMDCIDYPIMISEESNERARDEAVVRRLYAITEKLCENAKKFNLTSILEPREIIRKHLIDSVIPIMLMENAGILEKIGKRFNQRVPILCDVGSGAGFPCLPMAAYAEGYFPIDLLALDSTAKKIGHIRESAEYAGLCSVGGVAARAEEAGIHKLREVCALVVARAVASLAVLLELCAPLVSCGGYFCALKSRVDGELLEAGGAAAELGLKLIDDIRYELPGGDARVILIYEKVSKTPEKYPRRYSDISKKPLS